MTCLPPLQCCQLFKSSSLAVPSVCYSNISGWRPGEHVFIGVQVLFISQVFNQGCMYRIMLVCQCGHMGHFIFQQNSYFFFYALISVLPCWAVKSHSRQMLCTTHLNACLGCVIIVVCIRAAHVKRKCDTRVEAGMYGQDACRVLFHVPH